MFCPPSSVPLPPLRPGTWLFDFSMPFSHDPVGSLVLETCGPRSRSRATRCGRSQGLSEVFAGLTDTVSPGAGKSRNRVLEIPTERKLWATYKEGVSQRFRRRQKQ